MRILVEELQSSLTQSITIGAKNVQVGAIRPRLYRHGSPAGSLYLEVLDSSGNLVATSETIAISAIAAGSNYAHGHVRFLTTCQLKAGTTYQIRLKSTGYTFAESAYIGWIRSHEGRPVEASYSSNDGYNSPFDLQLWALKRVIRRTA